jgi:DNA polymerase-3 subunit alpha
MDILNQIVTHQTGELSELPHEARVRIAGLINEFHTHQTKNGKIMGYITLEDLQGTIQLVLFPKAWDAAQSFLMIEKLIIVDGKVDNQGSEPKILVDKISTELNVTTSMESYKPIRKKVDIEVEPINDSVLWEPDNEDYIPPPPDEEYSIGQQEQYPMHESQPRTDIAHVQIKEAPGTPIMEKNQNSSDTADTSLTIDNISRRSGAYKEKKAEKSRTIRISLRHQESREQDQRRVRRVIGELTRHPGNDRFKLQIFEDGKEYMIEYPNDTTGICDQLLSTLYEIVGQEDISIE